MNIRFKKFVAIVSSIALVLAGLSIQPKTASADISLLGDTTWSSWFEAGGAVTSTDASQQVINGNLGGDWWGIQTWLTDVTMVKGYVYSTSFTVTTSAPKQFRVDKRVGDGIIFDGEVSVSEWTDNGDGTYSCTYTGKTSEIATTEKFDLRISFGNFTGANGVCGDGTEYEGWGAYTNISATVSDFSLTREAVGETEADPEVTTPAGGYIALPSETTVGPWILYSANNSWITGEMQYKGGTTDSDLSCKIITSNGNAGSWGIQVKYPVSDLTVGTTYAYTVNYSSTNAGTMYLKVEGPGQSLVAEARQDAVAGDNLLTGKFTAQDTTTLVFELSGFAAGTIVDFKGISIAEAEEEPSEEPSENPSEEESSDVSGDSSDEYAGLEFVVSDNNPDLALAFVEGAANNINYCLDQGNNFYAAITAATVKPDYKTVSCNGNVEEPARAGANFWIPMSVLVKDSYNVVEILDAVGNTYHFVIRYGTPATGGEEESPSDETPSETETTTEAEQPSEPEVVVPVAPIFNYAGNDNLPYYFAWQGVDGATSYNFYVEGVKVAEGLIGGAYNAEPIAEKYFATAGEYTVGLTAVNEAGESPMTTVKFTAPGFKVPAPTGLVVAGVDYGRKLSVAFTPYEGATGFKLYADDVYVADITASGDVITIADTDLVPGTTYAFTLTAIVDGVETDPSIATNVEVPAATTSAVSIDGEVVANVEMDGTYTLPADSELGYLYGDIAYKAGDTVTVTSDMAFTSIGEVSVTAEQGAGIRYTDTASGGIRFQATVNASEAVLDSDAVTEGTLITANDLYTELGNNELSLDSEYTYIDVKNDGTWYNDEKGTYCGSIVGVEDSNWIRYFIAKAYVTITYADGTTATVYSNMTGARSIQGVATAIQNAGYPGLGADAITAIDTFAAAK